MGWNSSRTIPITKGGCHQGFAFIMSANLEDPTVATGLEKVNPHPNSQEKKWKNEAAHLCQLFVTPWTIDYQHPPSIGFSRQEYSSGLPFPSPIPKKGSTKEDAIYHTTASISHASKVMLKILHARFQHSVNQEISDVQSGFRKGKGTRDQIANICWITEKAREFQKNVYPCFIDYAKAFDSVDHDKLWKALRETGIPDHLTCLLRNLYVGQEATVRTVYGTTHWFKIEKGVRQDCLLSHYLFNL